MFITRSDISKLFKYLKVDITLIKDYLLTSSQEVQDKHDIISIMEEAIKGRKKDVISNMNIYNKHDSIRELEYLLEFKQSLPKVEPSNIQCIIEWAVLEEYSSDEEDFIRDEYGHLPLTIDNGGNVVCIKNASIAAPQATCLTSKISYDSPVYSLMGDNEPIEVS